MVIEIRNEIAQQKNYLQIMKDTLNSKCCKIYNIFYYENLNATNGRYGNQSPEDYEASLQALKDEAEGNDTLSRSCPISQPYPNEDFTQCTNCEDVTAIYNLETRKCEQCPIGKIFNYQSRTCDYNVTCPSGTQFNEKTVMCEKLQPSINDSMCPPEKPIWNPLVYGCFKCQSEKPYFDNELHECTACPEDTHYDPQSAECVYQDCPVG